MKDEKIKKIAEVCHTVNKIYCESIGDNSQVDWEQAPQWQKDSAINGVKQSLEGNGVTPEESHVSWLEEKRKTGWVYGKIKDPIKKTHPCIVPYAELPEEQKFKDKFFTTIVSILKDI